LIAQAQAWLLGFSAAQTKQSFETALSHARQSGSRQAELEALTNYSPVVLSRDGGPAVMDFSDRMLTLAEDAGPRSKGYVLCSIGISQIMIGNIETALENLNHAYRLAADTDDGTLLLLAGADYRIPLLGYRSIGETISCHPDSAKRTVLDAIPIVDDFPSDFARAWALMILGRVLTGRGEYSDAMEALEEGYNICGEQAYRQRQGQILFHIGRCQAGLGDLQRAVDQMSEGIELWREPGTRMHLTECFCTLAEAYLGLGDIERAEASLQQARNVWQEMGEAFFAAEIERLSARCLAARGQMPAAQTSLKASLEIARTQGAVLFELRTLRDMLDTAGDERDGILDRFRQRLDGLTEGHDLPEIVRFREALRP
jgi:tetratricopeptide (TPR) repeat protein